MNLRTKPILLSSFFILALALPALAGTTRSFVLDSATTLSEGKLEGTAVESDGSIVRGIGTKRIELPGVGVARSLLVMPDGTAYVGTGNDGKIYVVRGGVATLFAETKQVLVSALATDGQGTLFAGTLPSGKIFAFDNAGKMRDFAAPAGAAHIWSLAYDTRQKTLFAATGPEGKVFAVDAKGKADVYYDSEAEHIITLALAEDGALYAGTSDQALLLRLRGAGRADVIYDFDGNEVTAIDVKSGEIAVAANMFPRSGGGGGNANKPNPTPSGDQNSPQATSQQPPQPVPAQANPQVGKGQLFHIDPSGRADKLFTSDDGHLTTVEWGSDGEIYCGTGKEGRIHRVKRDHARALWVDVDERQVAALDLTGKHPMFLASDGAAVYEVLSGAALKPTWTSKVLDGTVTSRFGQLTFRGRGKLSFQTRSGNTEKPDAAWSEWSAPLTAAGPIRSPAARFLQVRALLDSQSDAVIYAIEAFYLQDNQIAIVTDVSVEPPARAKERKGQPPSSQYKIKWKADNQDGDTLRFRIFYKDEQSQTWRSVLREGDVVSGNEHSWDTDGVPDGYYRVRIEASDELDNPISFVEKSTGESEPILIDSHPPVIEGLKLDKGSLVGVARDNLGPIQKLEYTADGLDWKPWFPKDDLFDTATEPFAIPLSVLPKGNRAVVIRTSDARGNTTATEIVVDVP
jgi:hypothetical protein